MNKPSKYEYPDPAEYEKAKEQYRLYMVSVFEAKLAENPTGIELEIVRRRLRYWRKHDAILAYARKYDAKRAASDPDFYKKSYSENRERYRKANREYRLRHHDEIIKREAEYRDANRDKLNARSRDYRSRHLEECRERSRRYHMDHKQLDTPVVCPICGKEFIKHNGEQKYCSQECFKENRRRYSRNRYANLTPEQMEKVRKYMSEYAKTDKAKARRKAYSKTEAGKSSRIKAGKNYRHSEKWKAAKKRYEATETFRIARHRHDVRRRAKKADAALETVDSGIHWKTLAKRTGSMICAICGKKCDPNGEPGIRPTVDHIVPISKGGTHTWNNVQLLCMRCNAGKCDKLQDERKD